MPCSPRSSSAEPLLWRLEEGLTIACSLAADGDLRQPTARQSWCARAGIPPPVVPLRQPHGNRVLDEDGAAGDGDAVVGRAALGVFGADCPALVLAAPDAFAVAHCGWRSIAAGIVPAVIAALAARTAAPRSAWRAFIGPAVHPDDYEVDDPVLRAHPWPKESLRPGRPGRAWLDLPVAIACDLAAAGIAWIARSALCTSRDPRLHSHRRDGPGAPQLLVAWRAACAS
ncbi:MAG: polyphenol oxidase family protein [Planctomycetes bacterium]|nr:polyphenol oxidase family protein [Planctomycetota bacterium]